MHAGSQAQQISLDCLVPNRNARPLVSELDAKANSSREHADRDACKAAQRLRKCMSWGA